MTPGSPGLRRRKQNGRVTTAITVRYGWPTAFRLYPIFTSRPVRYAAGVSSLPHPTDRNGSARRERVRILVADDTLVARESITSFLQSLEQMEVIAVCADGREAVERALQDPPDVVLLDFQMPAMDGLEAAQVLRASLPDTGVILTTVNDHPQIRQACLASGADAFVAKTHLGRDLVAAIHQALHAARSPVRHLESRNREVHPPPDGVSDTPASS